MYVYVYKKLSKKSKKYLVLLCNLFYSKHANDY